MAVKDKIEKAESQRKKADKEADPLAVLFPERKVPIGKGFEVTMTPLSLEKLPHISEAFGTVLRFASSGIAPAQITMLAIGEVFRVLEYCMDIPPNKVPATAVPDLLEVFVEQNLDAETLGKWKALIDKAQQLDIFPKPAEGSRKATKG
jgi:hypothetical protein